MTVSLEYLAKEAERMRRLQEERDELLEAAKQVVQEFDPAGDFVSAPKPITDLKAAIAKAEDGS